MRRFKVGDLARVECVTVPEAHNQIVEVLEPCPFGVSFQLPDGAVHVPTHYEWIVGLIGGDVTVQMGEHPGDTRRTRFFPCPESVLVPLPGDDAETDDAEPAQWLEGCR